MAWKRRILQGTVLGLVLWTLFPMSGAGASASLSFSNDAGSNRDGQVATGSRFGLYWNASSGWGLQWVHLSIKGASLNGCIDGASDPDCSGNQISGGPTSSSKSWLWDTTSMRNGAYTVTLDSLDNAPPGTNQSSSHAITININNKPQVPSWASGITSGKNGGRPYANISWSYGTLEPDLREFQVSRAGPDGTTIWSIFAKDPSANGTPCTVSGGTYSCTDNAFPSSGYAGTYTYKVRALRESPVGPDGCYLDQNGYPYGNNVTRKCVANSYTGTQSTSFSEPAPTGGDGGSGGGTNGGSGGSGRTGSQGGSTGFVTPPPGQHVVGGQRPTGPNTDYQDFYTGEYSTHLPYQNRTLILPGNKLLIGGDRQTQELASGEKQTPLGVPIKDRAVVLPLAGALLLLLGAAHVKRLLTDR